MASKEVSVDIPLLNGHKKYQRKWCQWFRDSPETSSFGYGTQVPHRLSLRSTWALPFHVWSLPSQSHSQSTHVIASLWRPALRGHLTSGQASLPGNSGSHHVAAGPRMGCPGGWTRSLSCSLQCHTELHFRTRRSPSVGKVLRQPCLLFEDIFHNK
jgi:hypothetical protein